MQVERNIVRHVRVHTVAVDRKQRVLCVFLC